MTDRASELAIIKRQSSDSQIVFIALTNAYAVIVAPFVRPVLLLPVALPTLILCASVS